MGRLKRYFPVPYLIVASVVIGFLVRDVITDPNRTIIFADLTDNYRVRPEPSTFLAALDAHAYKNAIG